MYFRLGRKEVCKMDDPVQKVLRELDQAIKDPWGVPISYSAVWGVFQRQFPTALRKAFDWRSAVLLVLATFGTISVTARLLNVSLTPPIGEALRHYEDLRDGVFSPISLLLAVTVPWWMKDVAFAYFRVSQSVWRTIAALRPSSREGWEARQKTPEFEQFRDPAWLGPRMLWACVAWPWHFVMFGLGRRNPIFTYKNLSPIMKLYATTGGSHGTTVFYGHAIAHFSANFVSILISVLAVYAANALLRHLL